MRPFTTVAVPHDDIFKDKLTMDVFAADLWQVYKGTAPAEYQDPREFFRKTFLTKGMSYLIDVVRKRLEGGGGDSVIQLQTPFGGGKTHSLIALYHKAKTEFNAKVVVLSGTAFDPRETFLWEEIETQLTGKVEILKGNISPGKEKLRKVLENHQPLLILMDEVLEYTIKADGVKVGNTTLGDQTLCFMQELTETLSTLSNAVLVFTLPSSLLEHFDEKGEKRFQQLQKFVGRMEKVLTPIEDEEVAHVIRKRLFKYVDESLAEEIIQDFIDYAEREGFLKMDKVLYKQRFKASYPFQPEVIDVLYKRWGSFPTFQRTRGVLRLLALVVKSLKDANLPFISLGDIDLSNEEIRRELIKHIGSEYDSVIAADITSSNSGAKKVDASLGLSYLSFRLGTKIATTIFMYSFSGGPEKGATLSEIKLSCARPEFQSSIIVEALEKLRNTLFYLSDSESIYLFTNKPNLNRILLIKMDGISEARLIEEEEHLLRQVFKKSEHFDIYICPKHTRDIPDTEKLKLIIMESNNPIMIKEFIETYGERPRVYRNTMIFLCPLEGEKNKFLDMLRKKLAWEEIEKDKNLELTPDQKERVKNNIKTLNEDIKERIKSVYRIVYLPNKDEPERIDLGAPTYIGKKEYTDEIYIRLKEEGKILEKISPHLLKEKYLKIKDYVQTKNILDSFYKIPGELRIKSKEVLAKAIKEGVRLGEFGLGYLENGKIECKYYKTDVEPYFEETEVLIKKELCKEEKEEYKPKEGDYQRKKPDKVGGIIKEPSPPHIVIPEPSPTFPIYRQLSLKFSIPSGKLSDVVKTINFIKQKFSNVEIKIEISAKNGEILKTEYEDKIKEAIYQLGLEIEEEKIE
jgi:hypothetical protein